MSRHPPRYRGTQGDVFLTTEQANAIETGGLAVYCAACSAREHTDVYHADDGAETCYTCRLPIRIGDRCSRCAQEAEP